MEDLMLKIYFKTLKAGEKGQFLLALAFCFAFTGLALHIMHPLPLLMWACLGIMVLQDFLGKKSEGLLDDKEEELVISHVTPAGGNIFEDLGFPPEEAATLKKEADDRFSGEDVSTLH
jgi:hypothetical protein